MIGRQHGLLARGTEADPGMALCISRLYRVGDMLFACV